MPHIVLTGRAGLNPLLPFLPGFRDDFNRPDGDLIADQAGRPWTFEDLIVAGGVAPKIVVKGNAAYVDASAASGTGHRFASLESRSPDGVLTATLKAPGNLAGSIFVRGGSGINAIELTLRATSSDLRIALMSRINGVRTQVAVAPAGSAQAHAGSRFDIVCDGPSIVVYHDSVPIIAYETTLHQARTKAGIIGFANGPDVAWDDVRFYA